MKLPKPRKRGDAYRIEIMLGGKRLSATRDTIKECEQWASMRILEFKAQAKQPEVKQSIIFNELLDLYYDTVSINKPSKSVEKTIISVFKRQFAWLGEKQVHDITPKDLTEWRNARQNAVSDGRVRREISFLSAVFSHAVKELFIIDKNPFLQVSKPSVPKSRRRRVTDDEINKVLEVAGYERATQPKQTRHYVAWAFLFAVHTAMRRSEVLSISRKDIHDGYIHLDKTKNGDSRDVPLSRYAREMLTWLDHGENFIIPVTFDAFKKSQTRLFKAIEKAGINDLRFHDTRHEATSRFVHNNNLSVEKLMKITGHKDVKTLINTYYNPTIDELKNLLD